MNKKKIINYKRLLTTRKKKIAVWGTGYIGLSTMIYFAKKKVNCVGYDIDLEKINQINNGKLPMPDLKNWYGFNLSEFTKKKFISATNNHRKLLTDDFLAHFVAVPTEKNGKPYFKILFEVLKKISKIKKDHGAREKIKPLIIIESTLTPKFTENKILPFFKKLDLKIGKDILYSVAPRRDWFVEGTKTLDVLDRVFGSSDKESSIQTFNVLSIVCKKLHKATSHKEAEMVKSIENAYRHMDITLANQISLAYPNENIREVMRLVGTKWNINTYYPGFGTGGYCIPLSSQYVLNQVSSKKNLSLLRETIKSDKFINLKIADSIIKKRLKKVAVLGLSYKGNLKVSILSPVIPFVQKLKKSKINVKVFDPFFSSAEVKKITGVDSFNFPKDLNKFDCIVITVDHNQFKIKKEKLFKHIKKTKFILDNSGVWENFHLNSKKTQYVVSGNKGWLN